MYGVCVMTQLIKKRDFLNYQTQTFRKWSSSLVLLNKLLESINTCGITRLLLLSTSTLGVNRENTNGSFHQENYPGY
jgi:hypothetical protein